jgi:hypothetical protein
MITGMTKPLIQPATPRKRGNPNWGKPCQAIPSIATEFELKAKQLGLTKQTYADSAQLRSWCEHNKNRCYIPEWLLAEWRITVDSSGNTERSTLAPWRRCL